MQYQTNFKLLLSFVAVLLASVAFGQQDPYYSFNMFNRLTYNPGFAGGDKPGYTCITMTSKKQWFGVTPPKNDPDFTSGTPTFENLNVTIPITKYAKDGSAPYIKHGIGISVENDKLGVETGLNFTLAYAFKLRLPNEQSLSFGPSVGMLQKSHDGEKLTTFSQMVNNIMDPNVPNSLVKGIKPDFNFGVYYSKQNIGKYSNCYAGIGIRHLVEADIEYDLGPSIGGASFWQMRRNIYIHAGCEKGIGNNTLQPSVMIRSDQTKMQLELNANYLIEDKYWAGVSYRHGTMFTKNFNLDAIVLQGGMKFPKQNLKAGLAYDATLNRMSKIGGYNTSYGSVEIMVQYCFKPKTTYNPRIFRDTRRLDGWH